MPIQVGVEMSDEPAYFHVIQQCLPNHEINTNFGRITIVSIFSAPP